MGVIFKGTAATTTTRTTPGVTTRTITTPLVRVPLSIHVLQFVIVALAMAALRIDSIAHHVQSGLSILPSGGIFAIKYAAGWFKPLSIQAWVVHLLTLIPNLEMIEWFRLRDADVSSSMCNTTKKSGVSNGHNHNNNNNTERKLYRSLKYLFIMSHIQAIMTLMSHSLIGVNDDLQVLFIEWEFFLMRLHVLSTGLLILVPGQSLMILGGRLSWNLTVTLVIPPLAWLINQDILTFNSVPGIVLSTLSMIAILSRKSTSDDEVDGGDDASLVVVETLPPLFKMGWVLLAFAPLLFPDTSNDWGHTLGAGGLNIPLVIMAYGLNAGSTNDSRTTSKVW